MNGSRAGFLAVALGVGLLAGCGMRLSCDSPNVDQRQCAQANATVAAADQQIKSAVDRAARQAVDNAAASAQVEARRQAASWWDQLVAGVLAMLGGATGSPPSNPVPLPGPAPNAQGPLDPARVRMIQAAYRDVLGRDPDPGGLRSWYDSGLDDAQIRAGLRASPEWLAAHPPSVVDQFAYPVDLTRVAWRNGYDGHTPLPKNWNTCYNLAYDVPYHTGQDYGFPAVSISGKWTNNTPIYAVADGIVRYSSHQIGPDKNGKPIYGGTTTYPGGVVIIEHTRADGTPLYAQYGTPIHSMYAHLDPGKILVAVGQKVIKGDLISSGLIQQVSTDKKTGAVTLDNTHLHWEMRYFYDGSGILQAPQYMSPCADAAGPGYSYNLDVSLAHPDNFSGVVGKNKDGTLIYKVYHWTDPEKFAQTH